jgi:hypothetical protein
VRAACKGKRKIQNVESTFHSIGHTPLGAVQKLTYSKRGEGVPKKMTKTDGGRELRETDVYKKFCDFLSDREFVIFCPIVKNVAIFSVRKSRNFKIPEDFIIEKGVKILGIFISTITLPILMKFFLCE